MRRIAVLCFTLLLALPVAAQAAVTPTRDAGVLAGAIAESGVAGAAFPEIPPNGNPHAVADSGLTGFPLQGSTYAILTTGDAGLADDPNTGESDGANDGGPRGHGVPPDPGNAFDTSVLRLDLNVPAQANCLSFSFRFFSEEFPENVGFNVNDGFIAELDGTNWTTAPNGDINAPGNFAFDQNGNVISVNTSGMAPDEAAGTTYDGATPRLNAARSVTPGAHSLYLSIFDQGDGILDSAVFVDRLTFLTTQPGGCVPGATADTTAPAVSISSPANGSSTTDTTPTLAGGAGTAPGDSSTVTVRVRSGGTVVQTLNATASGGSWSVDAAALGPGTYTAQAEQSDAAGNTGLSGTTTFTITAPPPQQQVLAAPEPEIAQSVVAGSVSGTVRIRLPGGGFRVLGDAEEIPLGATIDATRGTVRLTSAANAAGQTQTADFSRGMFVVTQDRTGLTQLALTGGSFRACSARASASQRRGKRVRRLFGDGKGKFRTRGRHGAATVRGTRWTTEDRCDGTYFTAHSGSVTVRDFTRRRTVTVKRGKTYRAPAKRRR